MSYAFLLRRATAAAFAAANSLIPDGQECYEIDTNQRKVGNGVDNWNDLPYCTGHASVSITELGYLDGVTSAIQTQLNAKQPTITGAATTIASSDLTASMALVSDSSGKVAASSAVSATELGYLDGVTSAIQTQLNAKQATLVSGTDIKTINGTSLLGSGDLTISSGASISDVIVYAIALGG